MARYFMGDTRLGRLERMTMDSSMWPPIHTDSWRKRPQKKPPCNRTAKTQSSGRNVREGGA